MINYVKKKKKDEFPKNKLNIETNNNNNYKQRANLMQVIKKRELNTSNFDPMKYRRKLMNTQIPKKEIAKNIEPQKKINYTKKNPYQFFGPYNRLIIFGGGFCSRLYNKKYNLNKIYEQYPKKIQKNKPIIEHVNLASYRNIHNVNLKTDKKTNKAKKILIEENNIEHNNNTSTNSNYKIRYNLKSINKNSSYDNQHQKINQKINIREVNHSIKYLKLGKKFGLGIKFAKKEKSRKNENDKKYSKYLINISSKKNPTEKKYKLVFKGINRINKLNNISNPESTHNLEINQTPILTERNEERSVKSERILVKDTIEQFSMENKRIKKFSNLSEIDNILLKFSPIKKDKSFDFQNRSSNYAISSDRIEYNLIKQIPKIEPKKKLVINTNELYILSNKKPKTIIDININNKQKEKEKEKEIININKEEEKKEEEIKIVNKDEEKKEEEIKIESDIRVCDNNIQNKQEEKKEIENINNNIEINNIEITKEETKENKKQTKTAIDRLAKHKERLKKKNEANKQKENNKSNKIKNLAFELESKMFKKDFESEEEKKIKTEKENNNGAKNETNYNIPIINKKKMKKKVFDEI